MAEKVDILEIDASIQKKTISELKESIKSLKSDLADLKIGTEEYNKTAKALNATQDALKISTQATKAASVEFSDSINGMRIRLQQAQAELRNMSTTDPQFKQKAKEAAELANKLNDANMQMGSYKDNIGRYAEGFTSAFKAMGGSANALTGAVGTVGKAFSALAANPATAWIVAIAAAVIQLIEAFKRNTESIESLSQMLIPFKALWIQIQRLFDDIVKLFVDLTNNAGSFGEVLKILQKIGLMPLNALLAAIRINFILMGNGIKIMSNLLNAIITPIKNVTKSFGEMTGLTKTFDKVKQAFTDMVDGLTKAWNWLASSKIGQMLNLEEVANSVMEVVKGNEEIIETNEKILDTERRLRKEKEQNARLTGDEAVRLASLRDQYNKMAESDKGRLAIAKQISDIEHNQKQRAYQIAKDEYELIKQRNSLTSSNAADMQAEADAYRSMQEALAALNTQSSEFYTATRKNHKLAEQAAKEREKELKEEEKQYERLLKQLTDWQAKQSEADQMPKSEAALKARFDKELAMLKDNEEAKKILRNKYEKDLQDLREKMYKQEISDLGNLYAATRNATKQHYLDIEKEIAAAYAATNDVRARAIALEALDLQQIQDEINQKDLYLAQLEAEQVAMEQNGVSTIEIQKQITQTRLELSQLELQQIEMQIDAERRLKDERIAGLTESLDIMANYMSEMSSIGDGISSKWASVFSQLSNGINQVSQSVNNGAKGWQKYGQIAALACGVASNMLMALADQQDETTKEGFEKKKKMEIASATMGMLGGVVQAWVSALNPANAWMTIWGQIAMGSLMSAMMIATGAMQIANIQKTQMNGSSSGASAGATPSAPALAQIAAPVQYSSDVQGASAEQEVQSQRVYVTESDISDTQNRVNVAETESTF